jgi:hypothetical protein
MSTNQYCSKLANKRWQIYQKENNRRFADKRIRASVFVSIILSIIKLILWIRGNIQSKRNRIIEKVCVE